MKRRFVIVGTKAKASADFSLLDLPGTSGRLDVLLRCMRSALLVSHGIRSDVIVYLVLLGGELAPRVLRVDGSRVRFVRPDERALGSLAQKALARIPADSPRGEFVEIRAGIAVANGGFDALLPELASSVPYVLEEGAEDVREVAIDAADITFFVGDHFGWDDATRDAIASTSARALGIGPISVHADDAVTIVSNELDRRAARAQPGAEIAP